MEELTSAAALRRLAAWGLPGTSTEPLRPVACDELLILLDRHHVTGHALAAVDAGAVDAPPGWVEAVADRHLDALRASLHAEAVLVEACDALRASGVDVRVLKGGATAHLDHPDPALRPVRDVDLLVAPGSISAAVDALRASIVGGPVLPPPSARWASRYGKDLAIRHRGGVEIDLHQRLVQGYFGIVIDPVELLAGGAPLSIAGRRLVALDGPGRLVHAALHAGAGGGVGLHSVRDVAQVALVTGVDWRAAVERCERWGVDALFARGIERAWDALGVPLHPMATWARGRAGHPAGRRPRRQRAALAIAERAGGDHRLSGPLALPPRLWPGYLLPLLAPDASHLSRRDRGRIEHLRAAARKLRSNAQSTV